MFPGNVVKQSTIADLYADSDEVAHLFRDDLARCAGASLAVKI
jgi:hypothetical protein